MKTLDFNEVLKDFQYKPNFSYGAYPRDGGWWMRIIMLVENARKPWKKWELRPVPEGELYIDTWELFRTFPGHDFVGYSPSREVIEVVGNFPIPTCFFEGYEKEFISWMVFTVKSVEKHEMDEWFRYKGELLNDPHKKDDR